MMKHRFTKFALFTLLFSSFTTSGLLSAQESENPCPSAAAMIDEILVGERGWGELPLGSSFLLDDDALDAGRLRAAITTRLDVGALRQRGRSPSPTLCAGVLAHLDGEVASVREEALYVEAFEGAANGVDAWVYQAILDLPPDTVEIAVLIYDPTSGVWGAALAGEAGELPPDPGAGAVRLPVVNGQYVWHEAERVRGALRDRLQRGGVPTAPPAGTAPTWTEPASTAPPATAPPPDPAPAPSPPPPQTSSSSPPPVTPGRGTLRAPAKAVGASGAETLLRLVPPRNQPAVGSTRFDALVTSMAVTKVVFYLDGERVDEDGRRPFVSRIGLAKPARAQTVRAVALDQDGNEIDADEIVVNEIDVPFRVRITAMSGDPSSGSVDLTAKVAVPGDGALERVEVYRNADLVETFTENKETYQLAVPVSDVGPEDFLLVTAYLQDGRSIDDVVMIAAPELVEEVDVNLVEIHVVATDEEGRPVENLELSDFKVTQNGVPRRVESFAYADDVPLVLGAVIDTSGSMRLLMEDTRRAAARFLGQTILTQDRAFIVDFDQQPRLQQPVTGDLRALITSLSRLRAEGATAMYDAVLFSMLQFEDLPGRKALVVLTDGDDFDSRYGPKDCVEYGERLGVPIYIIGLGDLDVYRRTYNKKDLRKTTGDTGGRLFFVDSIEELGQAYADINAELRSQYTLAFYADDDLSDEERRSVRVDVGAGREARVVVGSTKTQ